MKRKKIVATIIAILIICSALVARAATLSPTLKSQIAAQPDSAKLGLVIIAFKTDNGLNDSHLNLLRSVGITGGYTFKNLGMVGAPATVAQVKALSVNPNVRSIWSNDKLEYFMNQARVLAGVDKIRTDAALTRANGGIPVSGKGDFSVMVIDSGIDATHSDLQYPNKVIQNVQVLTDTDTVQGFTPLLFVEDVPNTDQSVGHGTHCAGIIGGTGARSGGLYAGVAPGAKIIGAGLGAGLFVINALAGWEWADANQFRYNIHVISNSYGSYAPFDPEDPINLASKKLYDRNIVTILRGTANPMPYDERVVGAGYVDAHNAVRSALGLSTVAHPFNLFPQPGPEIVDPEGDQLFESGIDPAGTTDAQDILSADYAYDAANRQIVYTLTLKNLSLRTYGTSWLQSSNFKNPTNAQETTIYVTATTTATGTTNFSYGKITLGAVNQQTSLGTPDSGEIRGNQIIIRLSVDKLQLPAALGYDVVGMTSTATEARAQVGVALLFASDIANGANFKVE